MTRRPDVVVFDVNETLSDMAPLSQRFRDVGAGAATFRLWFATVLRDGFALTAAGGQERFAAIAEEALRGVLSAQKLNRDPDDAVEHVLAGLAELEVHPDGAEGVRRLRRSGLRLVTLSNGAASVAERLLGRAGVRDSFELLLSVEDAGAWKPSARAYDYAARECGVDVADLLLVAVHPWDTDGAGRAGAATAWINRESERYPGYFLAPDLEAPSLTELADLVAAL
jgi:2-haloacid dehalogenase